MPPMPQSTSAGELLLRAAERQANSGRQLSVALAPTVDRTRDRRTLGVPLVTPGGCGKWSLLRSGHDESFPGKVSFAEI